MWTRLDYVKTKTLKLEIVLLLSIHLGVKLLLANSACYLLFHWELEGTGPLVVGGYLCKLCEVENIQGLQSIALAIWEQPESSLRGTRLSSYQIIQFATISLRRLGHPISSWYQTSGLLGEKLSYPSFFEWFYTYPEKASQKEIAIALDHTEIA